MQFDFNGQKYRFGFRYEKKEVTREIQVGRKVDVYLEPQDDNVKDVMLRRGPNEHIVITRTKTTWETVCRLMQFDPVTGKWNEHMIHTAKSSVDDQFSRNKGRSIALGRFKHDNPGFATGEVSTFYTAIMAAWNGRFQQRAKGAK
jgi:hypothetical protein